MTQSASTPDESAPPPGDDHPEARARTIDNLKRMGLAMGGYAHANDGRFPPPRCTRMASRSLAGGSPSCHSSASWHCLLVWQNVFGVNEVA